MIFLYLRETETEQGKRGDEDKIVEHLIKRKEKGAVRIQEYLFVEREMEMAS